MTRHRYCPRCAAPLKQIDVNAIELDICLECQGIWFDTQELDELLGHELSIEKLIARAEGEGEELHCPACGEGTTMDEIHFHGVTVDACDVCCGIWLDTGELTQIREALLKLVAAKREERERPDDETRTIGEKFLDHIRQFLHRMERGGFNPWDVAEPQSEERASHEPDEL